MVRLLLFLFAVFVGSSHAQVCSIDADCDAPMVCTAPPLKWGACVLPSRRLAQMHKCQSNADCRPDENCAALPPRTCIPRPITFFGCRSSSDCSPDQFCNKLHPMAPYGECMHRKIRKMARMTSKIEVVKCVMDSSCAKDQVCVVTDLLPLQPGFCAPSEHGPMCSADSECSSPQKCVSLGDNNMGICLSASPKRHAFPSCQTKQDCPPNCMCEKRGICNCGWTGPDLTDELSCDECPPICQCTSSRGRDCDGVLSLGSRRLSGCVTDAQCTDRQFCSFQLHICLEKTKSSPSKARLVPVPDNDHFY